MRVTCGINNKDLPPTFLPLLFIRALCALVKDTSRLETCATFSLS